MDSGAIDAFHHLPQVIRFSHNPQIHVPFYEIRVRVFLIWGLIDSLFIARIGFVEYAYNEIIYRSIIGSVIANLNDYLSVVESIVAAHDWETLSIILSSHVGVVTCGKYGDQTTEFRGLYGTLRTCTMGKIYPNFAMHCKWYMKNCTNGSHGDSHT
ncbi:hypothetical protein AKJ16_DCAP23278 [Drosera capensis]